LKNDGSFCFTFNLHTVTQSTIKRYGDTITTKQGKKRTSERQAIIMAPPVTAYSTNKPATTTTTTTTAVSSTSILSSLLSSPSFAWLAVFVPALTYFVVTRFASVGGISIGGAARVGPVLTHHVQLFDNVNDAAAACQSLSQLLYISSPCPSLSSSKSNDPSSSSSSSIISLSMSLRLAQPVLIAQREGLDNIVASTWRHDADISRGYLLLSQASGAGRVWRWEVGGGPFAIGKTLHLDQAGCRSNLHLQCQYHSQNQHQLQQLQQVGSGGLAIDFASGQGERFTQGHLVVAEWGEGRIVRMQDNGARTPLLLHVPNLCETTTTSANKSDDDDINEASIPQATTSSTSGILVRRLHQPTQLLFTPFGDLMILERNLDCSSSSSRTDSADDDESAIFIMRQAVHVPALTSLAHSRQAHSWTSLNHTTNTSAASSSSDNVNGAVHVMLHHYQNNKYKHTIGGMALTPQWTSIYVSTRLHDHDGSVLLLQVPILSSDDDNDDTDDEKDGTATHENKVQMVLNLTQHLPLIRQAGPIAVTSQGYVFMVAPPYGLVVMHLPIPSPKAGTASSAARVLGHLEIPQPVSNTNSRTTTPVTTVTSLTLGEDGYLYMSTSPGGALLRLRIRDRPVKVPVNLVSTKRKKS
jgi:hypothetical protein